jgi:toxin ParE1/3/4
VSWRTTDRADEDLAAIAEYGVDRFGLNAALSYIAELEDVFDLLAMHPHMAHEQTGLTVPLRVHPYRSHYICYVVENEDVEILRVLGARQDWRSRFG